MKTKQIRFRLWNQPRPTSNDDLTNPADRDTHPKGREARRSRSGCTECRRRRVKCDETFPVCVRCQKRGSFCQSPPRLTKWQHEAPWIKLGSSPAPTEQLVIESKSDDKALLRYWLERASQIMAIDPDENPLSFPILEYVERCPSLKHALQSVGAGHRHYFDPDKLSKCLEERSSALRLIIQDLSCPGDNLFPLFLSVLLVGLSTAWTNAPTAEFGQQHLRGARALTDILLSDASSRETRPPYFNFVLGAYLYWDMAMAFLIPVDEQVSLNTDEMYTALLDVGQEYHPFGGYSTEIFYLLGNVGRYCRSVVEKGVRDESVEVALQEEMEKWEPNRENAQLGLISDAFRSHGLINLEAICYRRRRDEAADDTLMAEFLNMTCEEDEEIWQNLTTSSIDDDLEDRIRNRALEVVRNLISIPSSHGCTNLQAIPLFTAGSELTKEDVKERELVLQRFKEVYSLNHLRANLTALEMLPEIWKRKDGGETITWLEVMIEKGWNIMLG